MASRSSTALSVCGAIFTVAGSPAGPSAQQRTKQECGACRQVRACVPARSVLSDRFGTWDDIVPNRIGRWLCEPCAWAYKANDLRRGALIIHATPDTRHPTPSQLRAVLSHPIGTGTAVVVPIGGKRSLVPTARWGMLTYDGGTIPWTSTHAALMNTATVLRSLGVHERSLGLPSPPPQVLSGLPYDDHTRLRDLWRQFAPARRDEVLLPLMMRLSRKDPA